MGPAYRSVAGWRLDGRAGAGGAAVVAAGAVGAARGLRVGRRGDGLRVGAGRLVEIVVGGAGGLVAVLGVAGLLVAVFVIGAGVAIGHRGIVLVGALIVPRGLDRDIADLGRGAAGAVVVIVGLGLIGLGGGGVVDDRVAVEGGGRAHPVVGIILPQRAVSLDGLWGQLRGRERILGIEDHLDRSGLAGRSLDDAAIDVGERVAAGAGAARGSGVGQRDPLVDPGLAAGLIVARGAGDVADQGRRAAGAVVIVGLGLGVLGGLVVLRVAVLLPHVPRFLLFDVEGLGGGGGLRGAGGAVRRTVRVPSPGTGRRLKPRGAIHPDGGGGRRLHLRFVALGGGAGPDSHLGERILRRGHGLVVGRRAHRRHVGGDGCAGDERLGGAGLGGVGCGERRGSAVGRLAVIGGACARSLVAGRHRSRPRVRACVSRYRC